MKWILSTALFTVVFIANCSSTKPESFGPVGTWTSAAVVSDNSMGHPMTTTTTTTVIIRSDSSFAMSAEKLVQGMGDYTMPVFERKGIWSMMGDSLTLTPDSCKEFNETTQQMMNDDSCMMMSAMFTGSSLTFKGGMGMMGDTAAMVCRRR